MECSNESQVGRRDGSRDGSRDGMLARRYDGILFGFVRVRDRSQVECSNGN